jgi:hypothetical protein
MWILSQNKKFMVRASGDFPRRHSHGRRGRIMKQFILMLAGGVLVVNCQGQAWLDKAEDNLNLKTRNGLFRSDLTVLLDLEAYYIDQRPPGLIYSSHSFVNPLSLWTRSSANTFTA